jgi:hypothetical protein
VTFDQLWIENDFNPFIMFDANAKVISLNSEAQFLLGSIDAKSIYELAMTYASNTFGFKTTFLDLEYGRYKFFGITVGYDNEESIGIRLYQMPSFKFTKPKNHGDLVNVYTILDLCISSNSIGSAKTFVKDFDPTLPEIRLQTDPFIKMINRSISACSGDIVLFKIYFRVGEHVKYEGVKYSLFSLEISSKHLDKKNSGEIQHLADENHLFIEFKTDRITINIPIVTD